MRKILIGLLLVICACTSSASDAYSNDRYTNLMCEWIPDLKFYSKKRNKCSSHVCLFGFHARESKNALDYFNKYSDVVDQNRNLLILKEKYKDSLSVSQKVLLELTGDYIGLAKGIKDDDLLEFWGSYISSLGYKSEVERIFKLRDERHNLIIKVLSNRNIEYSDC